jgi:hypothetical protein
MKMNLNQSYNRETFIQIISNLSSDFKKDIRAFDYKSKVIENAYLIGKIESLDVQVIEIEISGNVKNRIKITSEAFKLLNILAAQSALVSFFSNNNTSGKWRFSLLTTDYKIIDGNVSKEQSNPRRYSYVLGLNSKLYTPKKFLINKGPISDIEDLKSRFSLAVVNQEFYDQLAELYTKLIGGNVSKGSNVIQYKGMLRINGKYSQNVEHQEFAIKLIGRLVFCWFLKEKKSSNGISLIPEVLLSSGFIRTENYYNQILEPLFFELLNTKISRRKGKYKDDKYSVIPYLNGGLFKPQSNDYYDTKNYGKKEELLPIYIPNQWFLEFYELLEQYNFTVDENTNNDIELSIDPEMLGRIFENLLAEINPETGESARKATGSFYTPREIVEHMVNNSMVNYLAEKTSISVKRLSDFLDEVGTSENISHHFTEKEKSSIIYSLSKVKVIDPACGSGAFPIGILQKMVSILQFIDPDNSKWIDTQLKNANDELKKHILESFNKNNLNYIRKLALIKDSIFGIDIQPIATEIAKLRCFLTLIVEEVVDDNEPNRGIKPLPNLDFKFVTANSLIKLNDDYGFGERELIEKLGSIRAQYFTASYEERLELQSQFSNIQVDMSIFISDFWQSAGGNPTLEKLRRWKPFDYESTSWFDSEWMFGVSKFDIIITNPPYLDSEHMTRQMPEMREELSQLYYTASGNWDLFVLFIELSSKLLNKTGTMVFIVPNKLLSQKYADKCREILFKNNYITEIRDYSRVKVFKDADVYPIVMTVSKQKRSETIDAFIMNDVDQSSIKITMDRKDVNKDNLDMLFIEDEIALSILLKMDLNKRLQDYGADIRDASTVSDAYSMKELIFDSRESITPSFKLLNSGTIDPYVSLWGIKKTQYIKDSYMYPRINHSDLKKIRNKYDDAISEKIVIANMTNRLEAYYDIGEYVALKSTILIKDSSVNLLSLSGLINSKLYTFYYRNKHKSTQMSGGALSISKSRVENLPIPNMNKADSDTLNNLVIDYINKKDINIILDIDNLIYRLFDLSPDQIEYMDKINLIC